MSRLPVVRLLLGMTPNEPTERPYIVVCWTNAGGGVVVGVTAFELASTPARHPTALVAVTVNVYVVPLVRPVTVADGVGEPPLTVRRRLGALRTETG